MMGLNIIDMLISILKFKDFKEESLFGKIKWIVLYPLAALTLGGIIIAFAISPFTTFIHKLIKRK